LPSTKCMPVFWWRIGRSRSEIRWGPGSKRGSRCLRPRSSRCRRSRVGHRLPPQCLDREHQSGPEGGHAADQSPMRRLSFLHAARSIAEPARRLMAARDRPMTYLGQANDDLVRASRAAERCGQCRLAFPACSYPLRPQASAAQSDRAMGPRLTASRSDSNLHL
jgi:hypothetical protein